MDLKSSGSKFNATCILNYLHHKNAGLLIGQELNGRDAGKLMQSRVLALGGNCLHCTLFLHPEDEWKWTKHHWYTMISHPEIVGLPRIEGFYRIRIGSHLKSRSWCAAKYQCNVARQFTSTKTWNKLSLESVSLLSDIEYYWKDRQIQLYWGSMSQLRLISVPSSC